jgi:outer membrane receptor for monomeric catechols
MLVRALARMFVELLRFITYFSSSYTEPFDKPGQISYESSGSFASGPRTSLTCNKCKTLEGGTLAKVFENRVRDLGLTL